MANKINKDNIIKHEFNVLSNILNPTTCAEYNVYYYSPILQGCISTRSVKANFRKFRILLDSRNSSTIVMFDLKSKHKQQI